VAQVSSAKRFVLSVENVSNRLATKDNLFRRGIVDQGSLPYAGECGKEESVYHLFFECPIFAGLWYDVCKWLGISSAFQHDVLHHFYQFEGLIGGGRVHSMRVIVIWFDCFWIIWKSGYDKVFKNKNIYICSEELVEEVKRYSWNWLKIKSNTIDYSIA
jgi:hypothetical protein